MNLNIQYIAGNCPVEAEGTIDGSAFYFRARGKTWTFAVGDDPIGVPDWKYEQAYGDSPFAAGWMSEDEARQFITEGAERYRSASDHDDDGQPTEQQEWADYDPEC